MSDSSNLSPKLNIEFLRKEAKALLKLCRSGDARAISRIRPHLPRLNGLDDLRLAEQIKLADVHQVLARERGHIHWAQLKREDSVVERFLVAVRGGSLKDAQRALASLPDMAAESIHAACAIGDPDAVAQHLNLAPTLFTAEHAKWPPLLYACGSPLNRATSRQSAGIVECARLLLDHGVDPNTYVLTDPLNPESRVTAVQRAMMNGNMPVTMLLMRRGAEPSLNDLPVGSRLDPPLLEGFREYFEMPEVRQRLQDRMSEIRQQQGQGPLFGSDKWWFHARADSSHATTPMFRSLLDRRALDPNRIGVDGLSMIHRVALTGDPEAVEQFLVHGADVHRLAPDGRTALVLAVRAGKNLNVDVLRSHGGTDAGLRPIDRLLGACLRTDAAEVEEILKMWPRALNEISAEEFEALVRAAAMNILDQVRLMLKCGFDPGGFGESGITALHAAAWHGHPEMVGLLLSHHAPVNARDWTYGSSPLAWAADGSRHRAADGDYRAIVAALVVAGADYESAVSRSGVRPEAIASESIAGILRRQTG